MTTSLFKWVPGLSLCVCAAVLAIAAASSSPERQARSDAPQGMVYVAGGVYEPLYADREGEGVEDVAPFYLGRHPVTNAEFLAFLEDEPSWRRSQVPSIFAEAGYLNQWRDDLDFGPDSLADRPVVNVSWFAAHAYAEWRGMRLPTTAEWELAASAPPAGGEGQAGPWYSRPASDPLPAVGTTGCNSWEVCDLNGLVWEWVEDFNSALVTGESRNNNDMDLTLFCGSAVVGASDFENYAAFLRFGFRSGLEAPYAVSSLGFRVAQDAVDRT